MPYSTHTQSINTKLSAFYQLKHFRSRYNSAWRKVSFVAAEEPWVAKETDTHAEADTLAQRSCFDPYVGLLQLYSCSYTDQNMMPVNQSGITTACVWRYGWTPAATPLRVPVINNPTQLLSKTIRSRTSIQLLIIEWVAAVTCSKTS